MVGPAVEEGRAVMHVFRVDISYKVIEGWHRRDVDVLAPDGAGVLKALDTRFGGGHNYRVHGYVRLGDAPRVLSVVG